MSLNNENDGKELSDSEMDALINNESPSRDIPMKATPEPVQGPWAEDTFTANGKEIKGSRDQILQWASMGHNYSQKAQEFKKQQESWQSQIAEKEAFFKDLESKLSPYKAVDEFAAKNPDWWKSVMEQYQQKTSVDKNNPVYQATMNELKEVKDWIQKQESEKQNLRSKQEDDELSSEVKSIRKQYPNIDFDTPDSEGNSLEAKVLKHAIDNGIKKFTTAFRDYYHDHLIGKAKEEGKEAVSKNIQTRTKLGLLSESKKPSKGLTMAANVKAKTYNDLIQEAMSEINGG